MAVGLGSGPGTTLPRQWASQAPLSGCCPCQGCALSEGRDSGQTAPPAPLPLLPAVLWLPRCFHARPFVVDILRCEPSTSRHRLSKNDRLVAAQRRLPLDWGARLHLELDHPQLRGLASPDPRWHLAGVPDHRHSPAASRVLTSPHPFKIGPQSENAVGTQCVLP